MAGVRGAVCSEPGCDNTDGEVRAPLGALGEWFLASHLVYHITPSYLDNIPSRETGMTMALALVLALVLASAGRRHTVEAVGPGSESVRCRIFVTLDVWAGGVSA